MSKNESLANGRILVGMGTCGLAAGAPQVKAAIAQVISDSGLKVELGETGCLGFCSREVLVDFIFEKQPRLSYGPVSPTEAAALVKAVFVDGCYARENLIGQHRDSRFSPYADVPFIDEHPFFRKQVRIVLKRCGIIDPVSLDEYRAQGGYAGLNQALRLTPSQIIEEVRASGLRGRGGGGFLTGLKWQMAAQADGQNKHVICNADEGDPGAFMDRSVLEGDPFAVIEGMTIAARAIGAQAGTIYVRAEYPLAIERLRKAISVAQSTGLLGSRILGQDFSFELKIKKGAGAFVCGEETALMASIEGRRGMPRPRPPFPVESGLFGHPTIINNVETFANVGPILDQGAKWYAARGTAGSKGTKVFALTGTVMNPGLVEVPMGITLREIIFDIGGGIPYGRNFKAVQIGGPSGGCIPTEHLDIAIDYDSLKEVGAMMGSGGLVVMNDQTCMVDVAKYFLNFITSESCGKCIPCREGSRRLLETLERISTSYDQMSEQENLARFKGVIALHHLAEVIRDSSLCGLGQSAPNPVLSTLRFFQAEYEEHIFNRRCPAGVCTGLLNFHIDNEKCTGCGVCRKKCAAGAIVGELKRPHYIVADKCVKCNQCRLACRFEAISAT